MQYTTTKQFKNCDTPILYLAPIDITRVLAVYTDYEGNMIYIDDLFKDTSIVEMAPDTQASTL